MPEFPDDRFARDRAAALLQRERDRYRAERVQSAANEPRLRQHWLNGAPMHWMTDWELPFPLVIREAHGATLVDLDDRTLADFCLGDTGAMFGHSPSAVTEAVARQAARGFTYMLPLTATARAGELLAERFGLPYWQMTQTATDANRAVVRWARALTGREKILLFDGCYHGALDEAFVRLDRGRVRPRTGQVGAVADFSQHARVVEFNDLGALERELAHADVACLLAEPVMTNAGMVLPQPAFWDAAQRLCARYGALLAIDETHTLSSGPAGHARRIGLAPDFFVAGKAIAGGVPCAVYGFTAELAARMSDHLATKPSGHSGIGATLAANALATTALAANLEHVMTEAAYAHMLQLAQRLAAGLKDCIARRRLPWSVASVGARTEFTFAAAPPVTARESLAAANPLLQRTIHLYLLNRGVLITPFHNMMLVSPATTEDQVQQLLKAFDDCCGELE
jgi:glutamate-1-semialdehyde 2,1-aminomutase